MRILLAGGGSGGHVTPLKAVSESLKRLSTEEVVITALTDNGFYNETKAIFADDPNVTLKKIFSGKYRRYKSKSFVWHITHLPTLLKNIRDVFLLGLGLIQSVWYFLAHKPDIVFCKGGFVCVPIGLVAKLFNVPLVIHDSDTRPGLTNRILARWAAKICTGMPAEFYPYPKDAMIHTGIPVNTQYQPVSKSQQRMHKTTLQLSSDLPLVLFTGGGNGAVSLNTQVILAAPILLNAGFSVVQLAGKGKTSDAIKARNTLSDDKQKLWQIEEFAPMAPRLLGADVVVTRTSASTLQECANARKAVIGIASPHLDDQKMNADFFASKNTILSLDETKLSSDGAELAHAIMELAKNTHTAAEYADRLHTEFAKPAAADELATIILAQTHAHSSGK